MPPCTPCAGAAGRPVQGEEGQASGSLGKSSSVSVCPSLTRPSRLSPCEPRAQKRTCASTRGVTGPRVGDQWGASWVL